MNRPKCFARHVAQVSRIHNETLACHPLIEVIGKRRVLIENHAGVLQYEKSMICVKVNFGFIEISGSTLELAFMSKEKLVITGCIDNVQLIKGKL